MFYIGAFCFEPKLILEKDITIKTTFVTDLEKQETGNKKARNCFAVAR